MSAPKPRHPSAPWSRARRLRVAAGVLALWGVSCTTIHITTPFGSTVGDPVLPTATDLAFLDRLRDPAQVGEELAAQPEWRAELAELAETMEELAEDRYWAAERLIERDPARTDAVARALIATDEGFHSPYVSAKVCGECHPKHFDEWSVSPHAYAQLSPVFNAMHGTIVSVSNGTFGDFCIRCHTPVGMNLNEPSFMENARRNITSREGVTCVVCHRVAHDYGKSSGRLAFEEGTVFDPVYGPAGAAILAQTIDEEGLQIDPDGSPAQKVHARAIELPEITNPGFCGACHDVTLGNGFRLEEAFSEYKASPAGLRGETCQDCHMGKEPGRPSGYAFGPAAVIGDRETQPRKLTNHMMAGPDHSIVHPGLFPHLPQEYGNPDRQDLRPFFAELTPGRYKLDPSGTEVVPIPLWLDFDHLGPWGEEDFEDQVEEQVEGLADLLDELDDALDAADDDPEDEDARAELAAAQAAIAAELARLPDFKSWGPRPQSVEALRERVEEDAFEREREQREQARRILGERQYRLLAEYRKQQAAVLRAGYVIEDVVLEESSPDGIAFTVVVRNGTDGHNVPTGFIAERTVFVQVDVRDAAGRTVFASGDLDPNGDVRDRHSRFVHDGAPGSATPLWRFPTEPIAEGPPVELDPFLFSLQSKFITRNARGGEREQILAVNFSTDPLPFLRPPTASTILTGRPVGARIHRVGIEPRGVRRPRYAVSAEQLAGRPGPFTATVRLISGMVPVNLIDVIQDVGFDYGMSARDVAIGVVNGYEARVPEGPTAVGLRGLPKLPRDAELGEPVQLSGRTVLWEYELRLEDGAQAEQRIPAPTDEQ